MHHVVHIHNTFKKKKICIKYLGLLFKKMAKSFLNELKNLEYTVLFVGLGFV